MDNVAFGFSVITPLSAPPRRNRIWGGVIRRLEHVRF